MVENARCSGLAWPLEWEIPTGSTITLLQCILAEFDLLLHHSCILPRQLKKLLLHALQALATVFYSKVRWSAHTPLDWGQSQKWEVYGCPARARPVLEMEQYATGFMACRYRDGCVHSAVIIVTIPGWAIRGTSHFQRHRGSDFNHSAPHRHPVLPHSVRCKSLGSRVRTSGMECRLCHVLAVSSWESYVTSPCLSFLVHLMMIGLLGN